MSVVKFDHIDVLAKEWLGEQQGVYLDIAEDADGCDEIVVAFDIYDMRVSLWKLLDEGLEYEKGLFGESDYGTKSGSFASKLRNYAGKFEMMEVKS